MLGMELHGFAQTLELAHLGSECWSISQGTKCIHRLVLVGCSGDVPAAGTILNEPLHSHCHIHVAGMPVCGKSTVARLTQG